VPDCEKSGHGVRLLLDPEGRAAARYNARWLPRAYALDEQGVLTYVQSPTTLDPQAPLEVETRWRRGLPTADRPVTAAIGSHPGRESRGEG
jgi:hypothetical protein